MSLMYKLIAALAVSLGLWFGGDYHGQGVVNAKWDKQRVADAAAVATEHERQRQDKAAYEAQIAEANSARDKANAELVRLAAIPHPHLVCHTTAPESSGVPQVPSTPNTGTAGTGQLPREFDYDPWPEARRADAIVEACRDFYNQWPVENATR